MKFSNMQRVEEENKMLRQRNDSLLQERQTAGQVDRYNPNDASQKYFVKKIKDFKERIRSAQSIIE